MITLIFFVISIPVFLFLELKYWAGMDRIKKAKNGFMVCGKAEPDKFMCLDVMLLDRRMYRRAFVIYFFIITMVLLIVDYFDLIPKI